MIYGLDHQPVPPSEIVRRIKQVHPSLGLKWAPGCFWSEKRQRMVDSWAITEEWPENDRRRQQARDGKLPLDECHDIIVFLPEDCSADEAYGYIVNKMVANRGKESIKKLLERMHAYNAQQKAANTKEHDDLTNELIEANAGTLFREQGMTTPKVHAMTHNKVESPSKARKRLREYLEQ